MNPTHLLLALALCAAPGLAQNSSSSAEALPQLFSATNLVGLPGAVPSTPAFRVRLAEIHLAVLANTASSSSGSHAIQLNLFPDLNLTANFERLDIAYGGGWVWSGSLHNDPEGSVTISVMEKAVSATIHFQDELYQVDYAGNGVHWVRHSDPSGVPDCGTNDTHGIFSSESLRGGNSQRGTGNDVDVMVVYSTAAKNASGGSSGMASKINLAVTETNDAYSLSGVTQRLVLVHTEEMIGYSEPSSFSQMLSDLRGTSDGDMDNVHALRNQYGADCVAMICQNGQYCGIAYLMTNVSHGFESSAFSVTNYSCATGYYSFGHELGHNMGCAHDPQNAGSAAYSYSYGFRTSNNQYRTVMAYSPGTRIKRFSSPSVTYNGWVMGDGNQDNGRSLNSASNTIADWRDTAGSTVDPALTVGGLTSGLFTFATIVDCTSLGSVVLAYSTTGSGPTSTVYGAADLSMPINQLPTTTADSNGFAQVGLNVPAGLAGVTVWFQALDVAAGLFSNGDQATIQ